MDVRKTVAVSLMAIAFLAVVVLRPLPARADATTTGLIIGGAVSGAVALITLIAIIGADRDDPEFSPLLQAPADQARAGQPRWAPHCPPDGPRLSLLCW